MEPPGVVRSGRTGRPLGHEVEPASIIGNADTANSVHTPAGTIGLGGVVPASLAWAGHGGVVTVGVGLDNLIDRGSPTTFQDLNADCIVSAVGDGA